MKDKSVKSISKQEIKARSKSLQQSMVDIANGAEPKSASEIILKKQIEEIEKSGFMLEIPDNI